MKTALLPLLQQIFSRRQILSRRRRAWRYRPLAVLLLVVAVFAAGCSGGLAASSWAGVSADTYGLIMANLDRVTRINVEAGTARWEFRPENAGADAQFYATPALTEEVVYVGGFDRKVYALNRENGRLLWVNEDAQDRIIGGLTVSRGMVFFGVGNRGVFALNQNNGQQVWHFDTGHGVWSEPLVLENLVVVTSLDHHVYGVDLETGDEVWRRDLGGAVAGTPAHRSGVLYVGSFARQMYALSARDGAVLQTFDTHGWVWGGPALSDDGLLYFGDLDGYLYALEAETFAPQWQLQLAQAAIRGTPLIVGDLVIVGSRDGRVYARDRQAGGPVWEQQPGAPVLASPVLLDENTVVVSTLGESQLVAYDIERAGVELWRYPPAPPPSE